MSPWLQMFVWLRFSPKEAKILVQEHCLNSSDQLHILTDKNADDIFNVMRKSDSNIKCQFWLRRTCGCFSIPSQVALHLRLEVKEVQEETVSKFRSQMKLVDEQKDPDLLPKVNKTNMAGMIEAIKTYLSSCYGVKRMPLTYIIRKTIVIQTDITYLQCTITMMLHLPMEQNKLCSEEAASSRKQHKVAYRINNRAI